MLAPTIGFPEKPKHPLDTNKWKREEKLMETAGKVKRLSGENWGWHPLHLLFLIQQGLRVNRRMNHKTQSLLIKLQLHGPCKNHATQINQQFSASWKITWSFSALSLERHCQWGHPITMNARGNKWKYVWLLSSQIPSQQKSNSGILNVADKYSSKFFVHVCQFQICTQETFLKNTQRTQFSLSATTHFL